MNRRIKKKQMKRIIGVNLNQMGWSKLPLGFLYNPDHDRVDWRNRTHGVSGEYRGRKFTIIDNGSFPCAYVDVTDCRKLVDHLFIGDVEISFNGEIPFDEEYGVPFPYAIHSDAIDAIGWSYNHVSFNPAVRAIMSAMGFRAIRKYSMVEILRNIREVIDDIEGRILV